MAIQNIRDYDVALHFFHEGKATEAYDFFGSHFCEEKGKKGVVFREIGRASCRERVLRLV